MDTFARRLLLGLAFAALAAATVATTVAAAPARQSAGTLTFCTDATYPPEEFYEGTKLVGSDIDIGTEVARRIGMTAKFQNTGFDGIIAALMAKKCDAIISGMNDTPERRKQVAFVDYISVGQSLMVKKGNPKGIKSLASLSGQVGVGRGGHDEQGVPRPDERLARRRRASPRSRSSRSRRTRTPRTPSRRAASTPTSATRPWSRTTSSVTNRSRSPGRR